MSWFVLAGVLGWKWLPAYLEPCVPGSCALLVWLPACLETRVLVAWCALLVRVACVLVGSDYLHTLKLVSLVRALLVRAGWK